MVFPYMLMNCIYFTIMEMVLQDDETKIALQTKLKKWETRASRCPLSIPVRNVKDGSSLNDMLHHQAVKNQQCTSQVCEGSVMTPKALMRCPKDTPLEILPQAIDLINQYYKSFKIPKIEHHLARLEEVAMEIGSCGTYSLTMDELVFGARQAWRNAPRCIGRIQWSNLQVFDARKCKTTQDMFKSLCEHLQFATNGGNLRSAITVFPLRKEDMRDFRVWNSQLVKYAGYQMPDGSIQGDPSSVEFTEICIRLGWKPQYGLFDVLPLVLQVNGEDPDLYEIPPHLILEVPMEHPQYKWFQDLGLKWYALPAVSNMLMEIGGLEFPACPFNGWYMGTEIGVRDFCDYQRYNVLEEVGRRMGLETHKLSSLWKDQALVTINVAVIYSFQKNKVTITDHHSAAESFMMHMETEFRLRGGCPADWAWLVPPMSGSLTPVFHQEMVNYILSPFFYYQPDPWTTHVWRNGEMCLRKQQISFKAVARAALFSSSLMSRVLANRVRCTVLYATETGKSQTLAQRLNSMLNCAFNCRLLCMEDYNFSDMEQESLLVVVTSTFGNGDSPGNGESFKKQLFSLQYLRNKLRYCVFGLGSRMYPQFCAFAHAVDAKLEELGAERVTPTGEGDELNGQEEAFSAWALTALKDAYKEFNIQGQLSLQLPGAERLCEAWDPLRYRVALESCSQDHITALSTIHSKTVFPMKLKRRQNLQSPHSSRSTILVELERETSAEVMNFAPGDHVGVFPGNLPQLVAGILKFLPHTAPTNQCLRLEYRSDSCLDDEKNWQTVRRIPACPLSQALTYFLDVTTPPCQNLLHKLSQLARLEGHCQRLLTLAKDSQEYMTWKMFRVPNFLEVLEEFPSLEPSAAFLLSQLPLLKPRLYSISSSPQLHPNELHLTLTVLNYHTQDGQGPLHHGVCSTWLDTIKKGDLVPCFIYSSGGFHLPAEPSTPVILVGAGSGIAPFRSFWQQRLHDMKHPGFSGSPMSLVFGCQSSETDHLYKEETLEMRRKGVLKSVTTYSRQPGHPKIYVQDVLREKMAGEVLSVLHQKEGHFYVCGGVNMAQGVTLAVQEILSSQLGITLTQAGEYLTQLKIQKRYHEDIFGAQFQK
ncbi:nitric oxide synthase, inducible-like [Oncorhynchus tshawytscha]|uniref:nitric oxide synthase, inducible-like n=1 Tax=Oncorhynchus tshawytscha TaxID=74940 RepID=UPI001C3E4A86|nr:nitric oxide synthase, inducible-like [Oncorhynchus tshawytscha]